MKHVFTFLFVLICTITKAQFLLNIDGETPEPFSDRSGNNTVNIVGTPLSVSNAVEFTTGTDYLIIDPFVEFDLDADWTVSFDINMSDPTDSVYIIDWRSNSNVGHMHVGYTGQRGVYFSDRNINGLYGSLVADPVAVPANQWVHFDVARDGDSLFIHRDGNQAASAYFDEVLSELSTTTIGYSEDFRYQHDAFMLDNVTLTANAISSITESAAFNFELFPNPATDIISLSTAEKIGQVHVYNLLGEMVSGHTPIEARIDVSALETGVYFLELESEKGTSVRRFIKN